MDILVNRKAMIGVSLVELMISVALGLFLSLATVDVALKVWRVNRQIELTSEVLENGRYLVQLLSRQLSLAGFYGWLKLPPAMSNKVPSLCTGIVMTDLIKALSFPIDGIDNATKDQKICSGDRLLRGTDVLVIRRASTKGVYSIIGLKGRQHYLQADGYSFVLALGANKKSFTLTQKDKFTPAPIREYRQIIYYVSDDHVFKRRRLLNGKYTSAEPLVEGVDDFQVEYGLDRSGDGMVNSEGASPGYVELPVSAQEWGAVVAIKYYFLLRSTDSTPIIQGIKHYTYAGKINVSFDDDRIRRLFTGVVQLVNVSARKSGL